MNIPILHPVSAAAARWFQFAGSHQLPSSPPDWVWHDRLPAGGACLLTGQWRSGKSTLASMLLARTATGGMLAGHAVRTGRAIVLTNQCKAVWANRHKAFGFGPNIRVACHPFVVPPSPADLHALVDRICTFHAEEGLDLVVIDPLPAVLVGIEEDAGAVLDFVTELSRLTALGICVLILHDSPLGNRSTRRVAPGWHALTRSMDVIIELQKPDLPEHNPRRRRLWVFSRFADCAARQLIEWTTDGREYVPLGDFGGPADFHGADGLFRVLEEARHPLTVRDVIAAWPVGRRPHPATVWRWLERAVEDGKVERSRGGLRHDPYAYSLVGARPPLALGL